MPQPAREAAPSLPHPDDLRAYVDYLRDLGIYDLLAQPLGAESDRPAVKEWAARNLGPRPGSAPQPLTKQPGLAEPHLWRAGTASSSPTPPGKPAPINHSLSPFEQAQQRRSGTIPQAMPARDVTAPSPNGFPRIQITPMVGAPAAASTTVSPPPSVTPDMPTPTAFNDLAPLPASRVAPADKDAALATLQNFIGDCTRCPLAYAGRHKIVFADGDPNARLMFVGEGPGADEDEQGLPFVGKAGQLLNNMIAAMGLRREQVYIANIVKCRPPKNRTPEPVEANTCSPFLLQQIDIVQPEVIVALGGTAATYLLGVRQSLASLRSQWFNVRGAKCAVTYHPAFLLRDPRQKGEAWKDLQRVMAELKLKPAARV